VVPGKDFCFVHAADLHLDTPFEGVRAGSADVAEALADASLAALDALVALALDRCAAFVLVAGDIYDGPERGIRAQLRFHRGVCRLAEAGIPVFVAHGNHDPVDTGWSAIRSWPPGVVIFPAGEVLEHEVRLGGETLAFVQGVSYPRRDVRESLVPLFHPPARSALSVGVLHCNVGAVSEHADYSPCTVDDLHATGIGYWALGHVHGHAVLSGGDGAPWVVYPGNTQGRSLHSGERGPKGAVVVEVRDGTVTGVEHVALDAVRFGQVNLSIGEVADVAEACELLAEAGERELAASGGRSLVLRAVLSGRGPAHAGVSRAAAGGALLAELRAASEGAAPFVWWAAAVDATAPTLDREALRGRGDFCADVVELASRLAADEGELALLAARAGDEPMPVALRELARSFPGEGDELRRLLDAATERALDLLGVDST
jgi:exonuclease SbcD